MRTISPSMVSSSRCRVLGSRCFSTVQVESPEAGPVDRGTVPAHGHDPVDGLGRVLRTFQQMTVLDVLHHLQHQAQVQRYLEYLLVSQAVVRLQGEGEDLPEQHPEGPHVTLHRVPGGGWESPRVTAALVVEDGLERHPPDRDGVALVSSVIILSKQ